MPKDKPGWGGKRENQTGRPDIGDKKRVQVGALVAPETKSNLKLIQEQTGESVGKIIDRMAKKEARRLLGSQ